MREANKSVSSLPYAHGGLLIEVMVCALLLSAGILAMLASQSSSVKASRDAYFYLQADSLVNDMVGRILANPEAVDNYEGDTDDFAALNLPNCVAGSTGCTEAERAQADRKAWADLFNAASNSDEFQPLLPSGLGEIEVDGNTVTVRVQWQQDNDGRRVQQDSTECGSVDSGFKRVCAVFRI